MARPRLAFAATALLLALIASCGDSPTSPEPPSALKQLHLQGHIVSVDAPMEGYRVGVSYLFCYLLFCEEGTAFGDPVGSSGSYDWTHDFLVAVPCELVSSSLIVRVNSDEVRLPDVVECTEEPQVLDVVCGTAFSLTCVLGQPIPSAVISGTVRYSATALPGVRVDLGRGADWEPDWLETTTTDASGRYRFSGAEPGSYRLRVWGEGYGEPDEYTPWIGWPAKVLTSNVEDTIYLPKIVRLSSPANHSVVSDSLPTLTWEANPEAEAGGLYSVRIRAADSGVVYNVGSSRTNRFTVSRALNPGQAYIWDVEAYDAGSRHVGYSPQDFQFTAAAAPATN
jgi:hypothetical protein